MAKQSAPKATAPETNIPAEQLDLPITFDSAGNMVTLRQMMTSPPRMMMESTVSHGPDRQVEITIKRLEARPEFQLAMLGAGMVNQERAIREVKARSDVGRVLIEIEHRLMQNLLDTVAKQ